MAVKVLADIKSFRSFLQKTVSDDTVFVTHSSLVSYLKSQKIKVDSEVVSQVLKEVASKLKEQVDYASHLLFYAMEKSGNWADAGEQQVRSSFCRTLLGIVPEESISYSQYTEFDEKVARIRDDFSMNTLSAQAAKDQYVNFEFVILGVRYRLLKVGDAHKLLKFLGIPYVINSAKLAQWNMVILSRAKHLQMEEYSVYLLTKEISRTPNNIMAMAALTFKTTVLVRQESLQSIFGQKWMPVLSASSYGFLSNPYWNISQGIKSRALQLYGATSEEALKKIEPLFIKDMRETILFHEVGHGVINHYVLPQEHVGAGWGTKYFGETIFTSLIEFFADAAPVQKSIKGALQNMIKAARRDPIRGERMFYMYLSDVWFYDTSDTYMYLYSDIIVLFLLFFIQGDLRVDFAKMEKELTHNPKFMTSTNLSLLDRFFRLYMKQVDVLMAIPKKAKYKLQKVSDYDYVKRLRLADDRHRNPTLDVNTYEYLSNFWMNMYSYVEKLTDTPTAVKDCIARQEREMLGEIFEICAGKDVAEKYAYDHRRYIVDRMTALGLVGQR